MNYPETLSAAREISDAILEDSPERVQIHTLTRDTMIRRLAEHEAFPSLMALLLQHETEFSAAAARQELADHKGCLEHCSGSLYAVQLLRAQLKEILHSQPVKQARKRSGVKPSAESPER